MPSNRPSRSQKRNDILILVMGPTGVGKSTLINRAVGRDVALVGRSLKSCTAQIQSIEIPCPGDNSRRLILIDTPGFDDTFVSDTEILRRIAEWLRTTYNEKKRLSGILYLHDISQTRMLGSLLHNFHMFTKLCGNEAASNVILVTTKWDRVPFSEGEERENELCREFWQDLIKGGSRVVRFSIKNDDALEIIYGIIGKDTSLKYILIQKELVELLKILPETEAGSTLRYTLKEMLVTYKRTVQHLQKEKRSTNQDQEKKRLEEAEKRLRQIVAQIQELRVPVGRQILRRLKFWS